MKTFALRHPIAASLLVTLGFVVGIVLIAGASSGRTPREIEAIGTVGRAGLSVLAAVLLRRLGLASLIEKPRSGWSDVLPVFLYVVTVYPLLINGDLYLNLSDPGLAAWVAANGFFAGVVEELVFRGVILFTLLAAEASACPRAFPVVASSLLFSLPHALNIFAGESLLRVMAQLVWSFLMGMIFAILVIAAKNIWPVAVCHGLANAIVHLNRYGRPLELTVFQATLMAFAPVPLLLYAAIRARRITGIPPARG